MAIAEYWMRHKNTVGGQSHCEWTLRRYSTMRLMRSWLRRHLFLWVTSKARDAITKFFSNGVSDLAEALGRIVPSSGDQKWLSSCA
jgi:hypothetical protein